MSHGGDIAIVGLACTYPNARNASQFWSNILGKLSAIADNDPARWDPATFYDPDPAKQDRLYFKQVGALGRSFTFNPLKYGIPPTTLAGTEPDHFLLLRTVYEALDDAGYLERSFSRERTSMILGKGNYVGQGMMWLTLRTVVAEMMLGVVEGLRPDLDEAAMARLRQVICAKFPKLSAENAAGLIPNIVTGRVANRLDLMGRNFTLDAACASSLLAAEDGMHALRSGRDDMIIAGGLHIAGHVPFLSVFDVTRAMSPSSTIRPFDAHADGTMASEGIGLIVMKRLADAERDGDRIYAVVKAIGSASDGRAKGLMAPRQEGQELACRRAYAQCDVDPATLELVEGHGTATLVGDQTELQTMHSVFGPEPNGRRTCAVGSVKSNIGHAMPAAGAAGLIKTALALYHRVLPPTINVTEAHPVLNEPGNRFYVNTEARPWIHRRDGAPRRACVNAFGFGGINAHAVLEEYQPADENAQPTLLREWDQEVFVFEADTRAGLVARLEEIRSYINAVSGVAPRDLAATLNTSLRGLRERAAVVAGSFEELTARIGRMLDKLADPECRQIRERQGLYYFDNDELRNGKVGVMFPGEGAQYPNMLDQLCMHFPEVRQAFDVADTVASADSAYEPPSRIVFPPPLLSEKERAEAEAKLFTIERATEAVLTADGAINRLLNHLGLQPDMVTGHSAGEWIAMAASGILDLDEFVASMPLLAEMYVGISAQTDIPRMAMLAVGAGKERVLELGASLGVRIEIANDNCSKQTVVVTAPEDAERVMQGLMAKGILVERLPYERGYHTEAFTYICDPLRAFFEKLTLNAPRVPVISCTTAEPLSSKREELLDTVANTFARPLIFQQTIERMYADGVRIFIEAGPRGNLTAFVDDILRGRPHLAVPVDQFRRPGLVALQHAVGLLCAGHVSLKLEALYSRRGARTLTLDSVADSVLPEEKQPGAVQVSLLYPQFQRPAASDFPLPAQVSDNLSMSAAAGAPAAPAASPVPPEGLRPEEPAPVALAPLTDSWLPAPAAPVDMRFDLGTGHARTAVREHFSLMEEFLATQEDLMAALLGGPVVVSDAEVVEIGQPAEEVAAAGEAMPQTAADAAAPLLTHFDIVEETPGQSAELRVRLDVAEHAYLLDHVLFFGASEQGASGPPRANMPLTGTLELLSEAASRLSPGQTCVGLENVSASRPIFAEEGRPGEIIVRLRRLDPTRIRGTVFDETGKNRLTEATVVFGEGFEPAPPPEPVALENPKRPVCTGGDIYTTHHMFHGPRFQGINAIHAVGENGLHAGVLVLPNTDCLRSNPNPAYLIDPHVFDSAGQLVGYWPTEYFTEAIMLLPIRIDRATRYGPSPAPGTQLEVRLTVRKILRRQLQADFDVLLPDGSVWLRVRGWEDWRFDWDRRTFDFYRFPKEHLVSREIAHPALAEAGIHCRVLDPLPEVGKGGLSEEVWTFNVLSTGERDYHSSLQPDDVRNRWLYDISAIKDSVRCWTVARGRKMYPADVHVRSARTGYEVSGLWPASFGNPFVAAAHGGGVTAAVAADRAAGIAVEPVTPAEVEAVMAVFVPDERDWIRRMPDPAEWAARAAAAKRAAANYLDPGSHADYWHSLAVLRMDENTGEISVADPGSAVNAEDTVYVLTVRDADRIVAVAWK